MIFKCRLAGRRQAESIGTAPDAWGDAAAERRGLSIKMRLRLLSIGHSYCVGMNRKLPQWMARLGDSRWEVVVVAPSAYPGDLSPIATALEPGELCEVRTVPVHFTKQVHVFLYSRALRSLLAEHWDMVHVWEEPFIFAGGQIAAWTPLKIPLVYYTCQNIAKQYPTPFREIENFCFRRAAGWLAMGQTTLATQMARGFSEKPCEVVPPCVDPDTFRPDASARSAVVRKLGWEDDTLPVIGFAGRFVAEKGLKVMMSALDRIRTPWRAMFLGGGPLGAEVLAWGERYPDRVRVVTGISHHEVPAYLNAMNVLCVPSQTALNWREQFGRVIAEAFSCGVPVIGSDSGEIPYVVGDDGIVVREGDVQGWAQSIEGLLLDEQRRRKLGERGREAALSRYSCRAVAHRHLEFFEQILQRRSADNHRV